MELRDTSFTVNCRTCNRILSLFDRSEDQPPIIRLGSIKDFLSTDCEHHLHLMSLGGREFAKSEMLARYRESDSAPKVEACILDDCLQIDLQSETSDNRYAPLCRPLRLLRNEAGQGCGLRLDGSWIQQNLFQEWMKSCRIHHGASCEAQWLRSQEHIHQPKLLIDTRNNCLVNADGQGYFALSYVWGGKTSLVTTHQNIDQLRKPGELARPCNWSAIARTIRDTVQLVRSFDTPLLWVDGLCIIQDDHQMLQDEIGKMGYIFANAIVTFVAGSSVDANHGLLGLQGIGDPRVLPERPVCSLSDNHHFVNPLFHWYNHMSAVGSKYSSRAWTFQEHLLSQRKIIFENQSVRWECGRADWYEDVDHESAINRTNEGSTETSSYHALFRGTETNNTTIGELISEYNRRELTDARDALYACSGIISVLTSNGLASVSGMPIASFDTAMIWQPSGCIDRRVPITEDLLSDPSSAPYLPSWSWAGWQCQISWFARGLTHEEETEIDFGYNIGHYMSVRLLRTVTWQLADSLHAERIQLVDLSTEADTASVVQHRARYVFCRTRRCARSLTIGSRMLNARGMSKEYRRHPFCYEILHYDQGRIGTIEVSPPKGSGEYVDYLAKDVELEPNLYGTPLDLVEISATSLVTTTRPTDIYNNDVTAESLAMLKDIGSSGGSRKIVHVLWIIWRGEYAERRALGWVDSRAWASLAHEEIDLALG